jgi:hypothetical protein
VALVELERHRHETIGNAGIGAPAALIDAIVVRHHDLLGHWAQRLEHGLQLLRGASR